MRSDLMRWVLAAILMAGLTEDAIAAEECYLTEKVCSEPSETRVINGVVLSRDCWAYKNVYTCLTKSDDSEDGCSTLNVAERSYQCDKRSYACDESMLALNGTYKCLHETETWQCTNKVTLPEVNAEWTGQETVYDERIDASTCQAYAADSTCHKSGRTCSESGKLASGYGDCTQTYQCNTREVTACTDLKAAGCTETTAPACEDGSSDCLYKTGTLSCAYTQATSSGNYVSIIPSTVDTRDYEVTETTTVAISGTSVTPSADCLAIVNGALDSGCKETVSVCSEKGGRKVINGRAYYERCWAYTKTFTCEARDFSTCGQLETNAVTNLCTLKSETCDTMDESTGTCLLKTKVYSCSENVSAGEGELMTESTVLSGYETTDGCSTEESDSTCNLVSDTCEALSSEGDGVCLQKRRVYKCKGN